MAAPALKFDRSDTSSSGTTVPSSPASLDSDHKTFSLSSIKSRSWRSFSNKERDLAPERANSFPAHARRLSKQRPPSSSSLLGPHSRRGSTISADGSRFSLSTTDSLSLAHANATASSTVDWETQHIEGFGPLESDTHLLKTKTPYLVVTREYLVKMKSRADALALLPGLATEGGKHERSGSASEPLLVVPVASIVSVFIEESTRTSFGFEVWWRDPLASHLFCRSDFFFNSPAERNELMHHIIRAMRADHQDEKGAALQSRDVKALLNRVHELEEPKFQHRKPDIFPVIPRGTTRREYMPKLEDATKKSQEGPAFYLVIGTYFCHLVEIQKPKTGDPICRHKTFGLVTLERFEGNWVLHEERFNVTFRDPFKAPVTLELSSRYYRQIIRTFGTADRFLKPAWPQLWQSREIFFVSGLKEPQYLVPKEDFGCFKRTLDAYLAAYRCEPVAWEINWKTRFAPEFRLLPARCGSYSPLQLLAVLRALRYNDYFNSLSFRDVDLSVLYGLEDNALRKVDVAYLSRTCVALGPEEIEVLRISSVLHQEFHALSFCGTTIRQIDLGNCSRSLSSRLAHRPNKVHSLQFLAPILNLLKSGITKCNRLILRGNILPQSDIDDLAETIKIGAIQALDVSYCGLDDAGLRDMILLPLSERTGLLQSLSVSGNPGRLPAHVLPGLLQYLTDIRELNLSGTIQAESYIEGSLLPFAALECMKSLEELDISGYKIDNATFKDLERFLHYRSSREDTGQPLRFYKLVLNHCGITGSQAARLFHAIGENRGMHLSLSGNPIEDGIEDLAAAIREHKGPAGLYIEMIEFKDESNYLSLIRALTETKHLSLLSLAGTAPSPSSHGPCSEELVTTLHDFFARNTCIRSLDLSGFSGKLDDGQLAKGFGRSLSGMALNKTMTHLRIRNQNLHDDAGILGRVLAENNTLLAVDCRDNNLNLTSLRFLVDSVQSNTSLIHFPFPDAERRAIWRNVLRGLQRTPSSVALSAQGTVSAANPNPVAIRDLLKEEESLLREVLDKQFAALEARLQANRAAFEARSSASLLQEETPLSPHRHRHRRTNSSGMGLLSDEDGWPALDMATPTTGPTRSSSGGDSEPRANTTTTTTTTGSLHLPTISIGSLSLEDFEAAHEYHPSSAAHDSGSGFNGSAHLGGVESPTETLEPVSEVETPAEDADGDRPQIRVVDESTGPAEEVGSEGDDEVFRKMVDDFRAAGFDV
ncbi:hypothetical protein C8A03DRAFT_42445 [Achaetomium macrosporum]|uniref:LRR-containing protein second PH domain-containing protein n=1 Tax=Achaetomium macrosporum TaxID=79813 RepID=A0AAN7CDJ5_9PEZI|nr:hypothetical protein C8A03DRAFT_42445 [Achaetomium macrosporum]